MSYNITDVDPPNSSRYWGEFFTSFEVSYDDDAPPGCINEITGRSADINKGFGGSYVWLIPHRAPKPAWMVDNLWTDIRSDADPDGAKDHAKGAGGDYRYFKWSNNMNATHYVTDIALWRSDDRQDSPPSGWDHKTDDINKGRGGDYLYLVWRTKQYLGPKDP